MTSAVIQVRRRRGWVLHLIAAAAALLVALLAYPAVGAAAPASIQQENALPGSPGWRYSDAPWGTTAQQYAGVVLGLEVDVHPGTELEISRRRCAAQGGGIEHRLGIGGVLTDGIDVEIGVGGRRRDQSRAVLVASPHTGVRGSGRERP